MEEPEIKKQTILVWNSRKIQIEHVKCTINDAEAQAKRMQQALGSLKDDPRWQILDGWAQIDFTKMSWVSL